MRINIDEIDDFLFEKAYHILECNNNHMSFVDFKVEMIRKCMTSAGCTRAVINDWIQGVIDVGYMTLIKGGYIRGEWIGLDGNA